MMTYDELREIVSDIQYEDWDLEILEERGRLMLRVAFMAPDNRNPIAAPPTKQYGRKWRLSSYMTKSEIVSTAFLAVKTAVEHEMREKFLYRGADVFGPHIDVDALLEIHDQRDVR